MKWRFVPRFSLRLLFVVVGITCALCAWYAWWAQRARRQADVVLAVQSQMGNVLLYDYECNEVGEPVLLGNDGLEPAPPPSPQWARQFLGTDFFHSIRAATIRTPNGLEQVLTLDGLRALSIDGVALKSSSLSRLQGLSQLRSLGMWDVNVDNAALATALKGVLPGLRVLILSGTNIDDTALEHIDSGKTLERVALPHTSIGDRTLEKISRLPKVNVLDVMKTKVTDNGLASVGALVSLRELHLTDTSVSARGMEHLRRLRALSVLILVNTRVTDQGLAAVGSFDALEKLSLARNDVTDAGLTHLEKLSHLNSLTLVGTKVTERGVAKIKRALPRCDVDWLDR